MRNSFDAKIKTIFVPLPSSSSLVPWSALLRGVLSATRGRNQKGDAKNIGRRREW